MDNFLEGKSISREVSLDFIASRSNENPANLFSGAIVNYIEKRIFRRVDAQVPVELEMGDRTLQVTSSNISCGGMFLNLDPAELHEAKSLNLVIHLPNRAKPVKLTGEVLRCETEREGIAVQFQGLYNDNILEIEKFVKGRLN